MARTERRSGARADLRRSGGDGGTRATFGRGRHKVVLARINTRLGNCPLSSPPATRRVETSRDETRRDSGYGTSEYVSAPLMKYPTPCQPRHSLTARLVACGVSISISTCAALHNQEQWPDVLRCNAMRCRTTVCLCVSGTIKRSVKGVIAGQGAIHHETRPGSVLSPCPRFSWTGVAVLSAASQTTSSSISMVCISPSQPVHL